MRRSSLRRGQPIAVSIALIVCVAMTSSYALWSDQHGPIGANSFVPTFVLIGAIPILFTLTVLQRLSLWFCFGVWLGAFCLLPWIPWNPEKRFFLVESKIQPGMSVTEMRQIMHGFHEAYDPGLQAIGRWDPGVRGYWLSIDDSDKPNGWIVLPNSHAPTSEKPNVQTFTGRSFTENYSYTVAGDDPTPRLDVTVANGRVLFANFSPEDLHYSGPPPGHDGPDAPDVDDSFPNLIINPGTNRQP